MKRASYEMGKRAFDFSTALLGLIFLAPLLLILTIAIKFTSPGPVFYRARRVGRNRLPFYLYKFRSMSIEADQQGPAITRAGDIRITSIGCWLRKYKLDELPQLFNVVKGDISLVGPRPEDPQYVALYTSEQSQVLTIRPGITSLASVRYRHEQDLLVGKDWESIYREVVLPDKLRLELEYLEKRTFIGDLRIIGNTVSALFR